MPIFILYNSELYEASSRLLYRNGRSLTSPHKLKILSEDHVYEVIQQFKKYTCTEANSHMEAAPEAAIIN